MTVKSRFVAIWNVKTKNRRHINFGSKLNNVLNKCIKNFKTLNETVYFCYNKQQTHFIYAPRGSSAVSAFHTGIIVRLDYLIMSLMM